MPETTFKHRYYVLQPVLYQNEKDVIIANVNCISNEFENIINYKIINSNGALLQVPECQLSPVEAPPLEKDDIYSYLNEHNHVCWKRLNRKECIIAHSYQGYYYDSCKRDMDYEDVNTIEEAFDMMWRQ